MVNIYEGEVCATQLYPYYTLQEKKVDKYHLWVIGFAFFITLPYVFLILY